jgi:hypothetical protein
MLNASSRRGRGFDAQFQPPERRRGFFRMTGIRSARVTQPGIVEELPEPSHKSLKALHAYWLSKKGSRIAPPRSAIKPAEIASLLPTIALIDVIGEPPRFCFRLFGTGLAAAYGRDLTGKFLDEIDIDSIDTKILRQAENMVRNCRVRVARDRFTKRDGRHIEYERISLPLSNDGSTVNMILVGYFIETAYGPF